MLLIIESEPEEIVGCDMISWRNVSEFRWKTQNALPPGRFMVFQLWRKFPGKFSGPPFNFHGNLFSKLIQTRLSIHTVRDSQNCSPTINHRFWVITGRYWVVLDGIWSKSWNLVEILIFGQNPEIWLKSWSLVKILKLGYQKEPLAQVTKCGLQVAPLALDPNLVLGLPIGFISLYWVGIFINQRHIS